LFHLNSLLKNFSKSLSFNLTYFWLFINLFGTLKNFVFGSFFFIANSIQIEQKKAFCFSKSLLE